MVGVDAADAEEQACIVVARHGRVSELRLGILDCEVDGNEGTKN